MLGRRRGRGWVRVSHGLHRPAADAAGLLEDLRAWLLVLPPSGRFSHLTAAQVYGWWLPPLPQGLPVFATISTEESRPQRSGLVICRQPRISPGRPVDGLPLDAPGEVLLSCARDLSLLDLVVLADSALHLGTATLEELRGAAARRRRGAPLLRRALELTDPRSESPWETLLRLLHVTCGVEVEPQATLSDESGAFLARVDLLLTGTRTAHEYDGEHHLTRDRQRRDLRRARRLGDGGWVRRGYTSAEVLHQGVSILRDADLSLGREHRPERIRTWHRLLAGSLFTPSGRRRLSCRLDRGEAAPGNLGAPGKW